MRIFIFLLSVFFVLGLQANEADQPPKKITPCHKPLTHLGKGPLTAANAPQLITLYERATFLMDHSTAFRRMIVDFLNQFEGPKMTDQVLGDSLYIELGLRISPTSTAATLISKWIETIYTLFSAEKYSQDEVAFGKAADDFVRCIVSTLGGRKFVQELLNSAKDAKVLVPAALPVVAKAVPKGVSIVFADAVIQAPFTAVEQSRLFESTDDLSFSFLVWLYEVDDEFFNVQENYNHLLQIARSGKVSVGSTMRVDTELTQFLDRYKDLSQKLYSKWRDNFSSLSVEERQKIQSIIKTRLTPLANALLTQSVLFGPNATFQFVTDRVISDSDFALWNQTLTPMADASVVPLK